MAKKQFDKKLLVCVNTQTYKQMQKEADERGTTVSALVRELIFKRDMIRQAYSEQILKVI